MENEKDLLIVEQQIEIRRLNIRNRTLEKTIQEIQSVLYCIGGPLNDNKYLLSKEQLKDFFTISRLLDGVEE